MAIGIITGSGTYALPDFDAAEMTEHPTPYGDTHVTGIGLEQTIDCNGATLLVDGTRNTVNALGTCWAVTVMGSGHTVVADNVVHDITVYGSNESVFYKCGEPFVWDRGRELGMTNRISHVGG